MQRKKKTHLLRDMKWVNGVFTMPFWWLIEILFTATLHFISIEIPDYAQINDALYTFSRTFLAKEPIYKLTLEIYGSFPISDIHGLMPQPMCVIFITACAVCANYLPNNFYYLVSVLQFVIHKFLLANFFFVYNFS